MGDKSNQPFEYNGYSFLNKAVYFKGGLPPQLAMIIASVMVIALVFTATMSIKLLGFIGTIILISIEGAVLYFLFKWIKTISKENLKGDRNYLLSLETFGKTPSEIRDNGLFKKLLNNDKRLFF